MEGGPTPTDGVRVLSWRMVRPSSAKGHHQAVEEIHLTPWDLRLITIDYVQKGILLPKPPSSGASTLTDALACSFARALERFYPFAGRLAADERGDGTVTVSLRCTGDGAEFVHAVAPRVAVADVVSSFYIPSSVVWSFYQLNEALSADAAIESLPVLAVQVTELVDGVFIGMSLNHCVGGDGTVPKDLFNTWSSIHRCGTTTLPPALETRRWFLESSPVPIPLPFSKLQHVVRRFERTTVQECFFTFSSASAVLALSRTSGVPCAGFGALNRPSARSTPFSSGAGVPAGYTSNAVVFGRAESTAGEIEEKGLGWTAWLLNRAVASFDEEQMRNSLDRWVRREPDFTYVRNLSVGGTGLLTGSSPRFDVFGNDFGWGKPLAVRSGPGNKIDGKATVFEGPDKGGSMSVEVCVAPTALARLVADAEFMDTVTKPA
ncbi:hypothetical protein PR202_gb29125 [Eleusine coracana subsp. coracana]|uniref:Uncharacterized protein n=1 Tax=Eleusine coracana subsp. coracana TaxID=191504 RepID=A0AAV5FYW8_ELECO|nr:hypothetical protein QOZ80_2BG0176620 [Eleusine coracana subsp. coracana]GJN39968.1 hypothetical protein PR202_gb29125 [Eleusine coracana subsp. coracana]